MKPTHDPSLGRRGFGSIRKRAGRYEVRYTDPNGIRRAIPGTFATRLAAEGALVDVRRKIDDERWSESDTRKPDLIKFAEYAQQYLATRVVAGRPLRERTVEHYQDLLDRFIYPTLGRRPVVALTSADIRLWYGQLNPDLPTQRAHAYGLVSSILNTAVADGIIPASPARIRGAATVRPAKTVRVASPRELAALANAMPADLRMAVLLAGWCALRSGELVELRRRDIDLTAETISITRAAYRVGGQFKVGDPKTDAGIRTVGIPPHIMEDLQDHLDRFVDEDEDAQLFVPEQGGSHIQPSVMRARLETAKKEIGYTGTLSWHGLRHTGLTLAAQTGATIAELMARGGHTTPGAAIRYQHAVAGRDRELAAKLSKLADM
jgi:integrase